ncbi:TSUP family transporter [Methanocaldococcus indicus]|uniref:TSUP family transporter n=1 Tax=Methanocaldococcus indicus TaxID=213231 RepID=UPI003C6D41E5
MYEIYLFILILIFSGIFIGVLGSLLGLGGGFLITPILTFIFSFYQIEDAVKFAVGTSSLVVFLNSLIGCYRHKKDIYVVESIKLGLISLIFSYLTGFFVVNYLPSYLLKILLGFFLLFLSFYTIIPKPKIKNNFSIFVGIIAGICSGLFGIGGGLIFTPLLSLIYDNKKAVRISIGAVPLTSFGSVLSYLTAKVDNVCGNIGYVSLPITILIMIPMLFSSKLGYRLYNILNEKQVNIILFVILFVIGTMILINSY